MNINKILSCYNLHIPKDSYFLEYLYEHESNKMCYLDCLPKTVSRENARKYDQFEMFYQEVVDGNIQKDKFIILETKFINVFRKLWMYSNAFVGIDSIFVNQDMIEKYLEPHSNSFIPLIHQLLQTNELLEVNEINELDFYVQLGTRNIASINFYFKDHHIILTSNWSCFSLCFLNNSNISFVEEITKSEGLFLRGLIEP